LTPTREKDDGDGSHTINLTGADQWTMHMALARIVSSQALDVTSSRCVALAPIGLDALHLHTTTP
jgi:hypothetical protein